MNSEYESMKESDWKIFEQIKKQAMEQYCQNAFNDFLEIINDEAQSFHERYQILLKSVGRSEENLQLLFEGHSKSNATYQLMAIRGEGVADQQLLEQLSEEFLNSTDPSNYNE